MQTSSKKPHNFREAHEQAEEKVLFLQMYEGKSKDIAQFHYVTSVLQFISEHPNPLETDKNGVTLHYQVIQSPHFTGKLVVTNPENKETEGAKVRTDFVPLISFELETNKIHFTLLTPNGEEEESFILKRANYLNHFQRVALRHHVARFDCHAGYNKLPRPILKKLGLNNTRNKL